MAAPNIVGPIQVGGPGGSSAAYDITAAAVLKTFSAIAVRINCIITGNITLNDANALVTAQTITAITAAASAVVTLSTVSATNPFALGNSIAFASVGGMTQMNTATGIVTAIGGASGAWTVTTNINSTNFTAYTSGGTAASFSVANEIGIFDMTAGQAPVEIDWPCAEGILVSAVSAGQFSIAFT